MKRVLIWGTGNTTENLMKHISKNVEIIAFIDNNPKKDKFYITNVFRPESIMNFQYDYLIVCSIYSDEILEQIKTMKIDLSKVIVGNMDNVEKYLVYHHFFYKERMDQFKKIESSIQLLITGISYVNDGIITNRLKVPSFNFAYRSQDLFCDFEIVKFLFHNYNMNSLKYVIIGLNYYSFEYDLSKSNGSWQMMRYYPYINNLHNLVSPRYYEGYYDKTIEELEGMKIPKGLFKYRLRNFDLNDIEGEKTAKADFNKNYPTTVFENKRVLKEYIQFLIENKVTPIFAIMPVTKYYSKYCSSLIKTKFYKNLNETLENDDFQILDYFDKLDFPDSYYYHVSHLNKQGAMAFTKRLNDDIKW